MYSFDRLSLKCEIILKYDCYWNLNSRTEEITSINSFLDALS